MIDKSMLFTLHYESQKALYMSKIVKLIIYLLTSTPSQVLTKSDKPPQS